MASASAKVKSLQEQMEDEKGQSHYRPPRPLSSEEEIREMLSAAKASATAKPGPPKKCMCKPDDPLCDCL